MRTGAALYCVACAALKPWEWAGKPCQHCGGSVFSTVLPPFEMVLSAADRKLLRTLKIRI